MTRLCPTYGALVRRMMIVSFLLLLAVPEALAGTYYVAPAGNDANSCAAAQNPNTPKQTISTGVACLAPGDTLYMRSGTYTGSSNVIDSARFRVSSGTATSVITIAGYPGETVTIQPPDNTHALRLTTGAPAYLVFKNFTVDMVNSTPGGSMPEGIYLSSGANHNRFEQLEVKYAKSFGIVFSRNSANSPFNQVVNCDIHHTGDNSGDPRNGHALYISTSDNVFDGNKIHDNQGYGLNLYDNDGAKYVARNVGRNNKIYGNGTHGATAYGVTVAWGADNLIYNNLIYDNPGGILVYLGSENAQIFNNTIVRNTSLEGVALQYYGAQAPVVRNNIVYGNGSTIRNYGGMYGNEMVAESNLTSDPLFANAAASDFHLQAASPARDVGMFISAVLVDYEGVHRPEGNGYDIGAYEFTTSSQTSMGPPPPTDLHVQRVASGTN